MERDTFADYDDFLLPQRERLPSDTCMSSSDRPASSESPFANLSIPEEQIEISQMIESDSISDNLIDAASGIKDTSCTLDDDENLEINMVSCGEFAGNSNEESANLISNLLPVSVPASNENSCDNSTALDEDKPEPVLLVSREGKRK